MNKINLMNYHKKITSQHGENGIIFTAIRRLGIKNGYALESGAADGIRGSNTYPLSNRGWTILMIECDDDEYRKLINNVDNNKNILPLKSRIDLDGENTISKILDKYKYPIDFDLLSLDLFGTDYFVWKEMRYFPKIVVIEYEGSLGTYNRLYPRDFKREDRIYNCYANGSAEAFRLMGKSKGYNLVAITRPNLVFIRKDLSSYFNIISKEELKKYVEYYHRNVDFNDINEKWNNLKKEFNFNDKDDKPIKRVF